MSTATTAEEALLKAKAIAARLSGNDAPLAQTENSISSAPAAAAAAPNGGDNQADASSGTGTKRKRWGVAPAIVTNAAQVALPGLAEAAKRAKTASSNSNTPSTKKVWIRKTGERGAAHFKAYFATRLSNLQEKLNESLGQTGEDKVQLALKGRGSSDEPALPGIPEEPLHILVTAPSDAVLAQAELPVDEILTQAEQAPVEAVDPEEVKAAAKLAARSTEGTDGYSMALTVTGSSTSGYRPATVAQLIATNPIHAATNGADLLEEEVLVPNGVVGFLIGRGGETITSMQARSACKIQIQKEHDLTPGQTNRVITLQAATQESIDQCREMIESMVQDRIRAAGGTISGGLNGNGSNNKDAKVQEALAAGHALVTVEVPDADVGLIIGKAGSTIKSIQDQTGAQVQIPPTTNSEDSGMRTVSVTHPTEEGANMAKQRIEELLKSKPSFSHQNGGSSAAGPQITVQVLIPDHDVGLCIGRQGCVIREIQQKTGTRIQIPSQPTPGQPHRVATVTGTQEGCNKVQAYIERIIAEQSSACVMSSSLPQQNYYQQNYQNATNNNSAEWQAYYAAQAVAQQQGQQQQQQQMQAATAPAPAAAAPTPDTYYEQFFRYAYYYGEPAARQYYGAWSPPVGTPNPYGVNPNGVTAPPAAPQAQPTAPAPAPAAPTQHAPRDTSVRKVSNLPAWMTQGT